MRVFYITHEAFRGHHTGLWHPERAERLSAVERGVEDSGFSVEKFEAPEVDATDLYRVHLPEYVDGIRILAESGGGSVDLDTVVSPASYEAALRGAGSGIVAIDRLSSSEDATAFCAIRPPGHHALADAGMGFCLFNNVVVAARHLRDMGERVAILDWDVHHGNGTQTLVESDPEILYVSLHQHPLYPGDGMVDENGVGEGEGTVMNLPLPPGTAGDVYRTVFDELVIPILRKFVPGWVLISAGYDAHIDDPLAELNLTASDYHFIASRLTDVVPFWRVITFLEGGYDLDALRSSTSATLRGLAGSGEVLSPGLSGQESWTVLEAMSAGAAERWHL